MYKLRFLAPVGFLAAVAGFSAVVMLLWNWLMPSIFGLCVVSFWQALGMLVLCRLLFGSFGGWHHKIHRGHGGGMHGLHHMREKWMKMTPEQRKEFIDRRKEYVGRNGFFGRPDFNPCATDENAPKERE